MEHQISELKLILQKRKNIIITVHRSPDADALGSALALKDILIQLNHDVSIISPDSYASFLNWMTNDDVILFCDNEDKSRQLILDSDVIFLMDFNSLDRLSDLSSLVKTSTSKKIMIDHHQDPDINCADIIISSPHMSSTCELLYNVINNLGFIKLVNKKVAEYLYTGIMTDTGSFKFSSTTSDTHLIISNLIKHEIDNSEIHSKIYDNYSEDKMNLLGHCISERMLIFQNYKSAIIYLKKEDLNKFNFKKGDTEGVVNYALAVSNIIFGVLIVEKDDGLVKMSFRSKGNFKVNKIAKKYFNGGGHVNASGGISNYGIDETIKKLKDIFAKYKDELLMSN